MTAPVMQTPNTDDNWNVQFVMPSTMSMNTMPSPNSANIALIEQGSKQVAVIRFSGRITSANIAKHQQELEAFIQEQNLNIVDTPVYAFYNPPWTLPFLRRNEVMFEIVQ